jgi:hypothetical protein
MIIYYFKNFIYNIHLILHIHHHHHYNRFKNNDRFNNLIHFHLVNIIYILM